MLICSTQLENTLYIKVLPAIDSLGYEIIRLRLRRNQNFSNLQIIIDRKDNDSVTINDCEKVSRAVSDVLGEDDIDGKYTLEVSSPGVDRPLTRCIDFQRYTDHEVRITLNRPIDGSKRIYGSIKNAGEISCVIHIQGASDIELQYADIKEACLYNALKLKPK